VRPSDETYAYIIAPATTIEKLEQKHSKKNIHIFSNTPEIQAVKNSDLHICQAVFYKSGQIEISDGLILASESPGIFMLQMEDGTLSEISVSDPNRELRKMHFSLKIRTEGIGDNYNAKWNEKKGISEISIDLLLNVYAGKSVTIKF
jgi:chondroitin AC lyase